MMDAQTQGSGEAEGKPGKNGRQFLIAVLSFLALALWIGILNWLFVRYKATNYFTWFLKNGTLISAATAFFALVWKGLEQQKGLLSWHPLAFLGSCAGLAAVFYAVVAANLGGPLDGVNRRADDSVFIAEALWDAVFGLIMDGLMGLVVLGWLLVIAPGFYVLTLFTGAPARKELRGTGRRVVVETEGTGTTIAEQPSSLPVRPGAVDVSFGTQPFALTNALNAAVIFLANMLIIGTG
jgi:hypothetical protein